MTRTAKQRIERAVERICYPDYVGNPTVAYKDAVAMILAERARLKRKVRKLTAFRCIELDDPEADRKAFMLDDILKLWEA